MQELGRVIFVKSFLLTMSTPSDQVSFSIVKFFCGNLEGYLKLRTLLG